MIVELLILAGGAIYAIADGRTGFKTTKKLINAVKAGVDKIRYSSLTPAQKVEKLVEAYAMRVDKFREGVAQLEANSIQSVRIVDEELKTSAEAKRLAVSAITKGKEPEAKQAMTIALCAEDRARLYNDNAIRYGELAKGMRKELSNVEGELDMVKTSADSIRVHAEIAEMNKHLYQLISGISSDGFTSLGQLKQLAEQTERDAMASSIKIELAKSSSESIRRNFRQLTQASRVDEELERMKERRALTEGNKETAQ